MGEDKITNVLPLKLYNKIAPSCELGIWNIYEDEDFFISKLDLSTSEIDYFEKIKGRRRVEWLAVRYLLHFMSGRKNRGSVIKDEFGKPHLENSEWHISISHTDGKAAVVASPKLIGIDIQKFVARIDRIAHKFMRPKESECLQEETQLEHLHFFWGAKEALYKAYGRKQLDFKKHLFVDPFSYQEKGTTTAKVIKGDYQKSFDVHFDKIENFFLVWVMETD